MWGSKASMKLPNDSKANQVLFIFNELIQQLVTGLN